MPKSIWLSKVFWFNSLSILAALLAELANVPTFSNPAVLKTIIFAQAIVNGLLRLVTDQPVTMRATALILAACLIGSPVMAEDGLPVPAPELGNPTAANAPPEPETPDDPPAASILLANAVMAPTDRCQCNPCVCDPCVCGYAATASAGRWESRKFCEGGQCRIDRVWVAERRKETATVESRQTNCRRRGVFKVRGRR